MSAIAPISQGFIKSFSVPAGNAVRNAVTSAAQATAGSAATGEMATLASTGLWSTIAYLGQALKSLSITTAAASAPAVAGFTTGIAAGSGTTAGVVTTSLSSSLLASKLFSIPFLGTAVAAGDLVTGGAAGLAAYSLSSFSKIATGKGLIGHLGSAASTIGSVASSAGRGIAGLFKAGPKVV